MHRLFSSPSLFLFFAYRPPIVSSNFSIKCPTHLRRVGSPPILLFPLSISLFLLLARIVNGLPLDSWNSKTGRNFWGERKGDEIALGEREGQWHVCEWHRERETHDTTHVVGVSYWYFIVRSAWFVVLLYCRCSERRDARQRLLSRIASYRIAGCKDRDAGSA